MLFKDEVRERRYIKKKHNTVTIGNSSPLIKKKKKIPQRHNRGEIWE